MDQFDRFSRGGRSTRVHRGLVLIAAAAATVLFAAAVFPGRPASAPRTEADVAHELAQAITGANTAGERYQALLDVMRATDVGVYSGSGKQLVSGDESGANDLYVYDFELRAMAAALGRNDLASVDDDAADLSKLSKKGGGEQISGSELSGILADGVNSSIASPSAADSLVPLLARELGLAHEKSYDLGSGVPASKPSLDVLQQFLIKADAAVAILRETGHPLRSATAAADPCDFEGEGGEWAAFGRWAASWVPGLDKVGQVGGAVVDVFHVGQLAYSVQVTGKPSGKNLTADMGRAGKNKAGKFHVTIHVEMLDDLSKSKPAKCGWLAGVQFPEKGPMRRIRVDWVRRAVVPSSPEKLDAWGTAKFDDVTSKVGEASFAFTAGTYSRKLCGGPGWCPLEGFDASGILIAFPRYLEKFSVPGKVLQYGPAAKTVGNNWTVRTYCYMTPKPARC